jgi:hypothetical protein
MQAVFALPDDVVNLVVQFTGASKWSWYLTLRALGRDVLTPAGHVPTVIERIAQVQRYCKRACLGLVEVGVDPVPPLPCLVTETLLARATLQCVPHDILGRVMCCVLGLLVEAGTMDGAETLMRLVTAAPVSLYFVKPWAAAQAFWRRQLSVLKVLLSDANTADLMWVDEILQNWDDGIARAAGAFTVLVANNAHVQNGFFPAALHLFMDLGWKPKAGYPLIVTVVQASLNNDLDLVSRVTREVVAALPAYSPLLAGVVRAAMDAGSEQVVLTMAAEGVDCVAALVHPDSLRFPSRAVSNEMWFHEAYVKFVLGAVAAMAPSQAAAVANALLAEVLIGHWKMDWVTVPETGAGSMLFIPRSPLCRGLMAYVTQPAPWMDELVTVSCHTEKALFMLRYPVVRAAVRGRTDLDWAPFLESVETFLACAVWDGVLKSMVQFIMEDLFAAGPLVSVVQVRSSWLPMNLDGVLAPALRQRSYSALVHDMLADPLEFWKVLELGYQLQRRLTLPERVALPWLQYPLVTPGAILTWALLRRILVMPVHRVGDVDHVANMVVAPTFSNVAPLPAPYDPVSDEAEDSLHHLAHDHPSVQTIRRVLGKQVANWLLPVAVLGGTGSLCALAFVVGDPEVYVHALDPGVCVSLRIDGAGWVPFRNRFDASGNPVVSMASLLFSSSPPSPPSPPHAGPTAPEEDTFWQTIG